MVLKFIYSEKAAKFCQIFTLLLSYVVPVKSKVKVSQIFLAFLECINFAKEIFGEKKNTGKITDSYEEILRVTHK